MKNTKNQIKSIVMMLIVATFIAILPNACHKHCNDDDNGNITTHDVSITQPIKGVILEGPWEATIIQDNENNSAHLEYSESMNNRIRAELLSNGYLRLKITYQGNTYRKTFRATIHAANLEKIEASGAATIWTSGIYTLNSDISLSGSSKLEGFAMEGERVKIKLSGASKIQDFTFEGSRLEADLSGSSHFTADNILVDNCNLECTGASKCDICGYATKTDFSGSGSSHYKTLHLESENLHINLSGASTGEITVNNTIKGALSGSSHLKYRRATDVTGVHLSGASTITKID